MRISAFLRSPAGSVLRYSFSLGLLVWLGWRVEWSQFGGLKGIDWLLAAPAVVLAGVAYPLQAWRWGVILRTQGIAQSARWVHGVFWIGQFYNSFLPGGVAGDAVRLSRLWRVAPDRRAGAAASLLVDRLLGLGSLLVLATVAIGVRFAVGGAVVGLKPLLIASGAACLAVLGVFWSLVCSRRWEPLSCRFLGEERARTLHDAMTSLASHRASLAGAVVLSVLTWIADFLSLWLLARAVGLSTGLLALTVAAAAAYVAAAMPVSIGGHGVREVSLVSVLVLLGHGSDADGSLALLALAFWALSVLWSLVGGGVHLLSLTTGWPVPRKEVEAQVRPGSAAPVR